MYLFQASYSPEEKVPLSICDFIVLPQDFSAQQETVDKFVLFKEASGNISVYGK